MEITNLRYADPGRTVLAAEVDGITRTVPAAPGNRHYQWVLEQGLPIADYTPPPTPTPAELDAEADAAATRVLGTNKETTALGLVLADVVERAFGVSQAQAREQVLTRFRNYYRGL